MKKIACLSAALVSFVVLPSSAQNTKVTVGGVSDGNGTVITSNLAWKSNNAKESSWSQYVDVNSIFRRNNGVTSRNEVNMFGKLNYDLNKKHYLQTAIRVEYNKFTRFSKKYVIGFGHGYYLLRTERSQLSAETSVAQAFGSGLSQLIFRESIWASHKFNDKSEISNKILYESGGIFHEIRNVLALNYQLTDSVLASLVSTRTLSRGALSTSVVSINLGVNF